MFDKKDPVTMALTTLVISFTLLVCILYLVKPSWVEIVDQNTGKSSISWRLVLSYSTIFALVFAIAVLLLVSNQRKTDTAIVYDAQSAFPDSSMASTWHDKHYAQSAFHDSSMSSAY